ncbi:hypothetical protein EB796_009376 [Bugula neritina]|uniref:Uncharacterized protein n=1 Tax=Bugula neritina TaxID=10212 RepID=A0A7J7K2F7_BUGNE|nr:hypothetical protein EB796_009376 [Bugula neritina]
MQSVADMSVTVHKMASFIAKQLVGKQLNAVKGAVGGGGDDKKDEDEKKTEDGEDLEVLEARREEEERRRERHRKAEEEREEVRAQIRKKLSSNLNPINMKQACAEFSTISVIIDEIHINIKKKETFSAMEDPNRAGQIGRKRKTPEELAAEARGESTEDDGGQGGFLPGNMSEMQAKLTEGPGQLLSSAQEKCSVM